MQTQYQLDPIRAFLIRYQSALVVLVGFACAFALGLVLWHVASTALPGLTPLQLTELPAAPKTEPAHPAAKSGTGAHEAADVLVSPPVAGVLSPVFTREVLRWEPEIIRWAADFELDPNLVAAVMQIESCGNPQAVSYAGAQGLFQVMPFHFASEEDMLDPETNAGRGVAYLAEMLGKNSNDVGLALAAYNAGPAAASRGWDAWSAETQRYYRWGTGIYGDIAAGLQASPTLAEWLAAGGESLCRQAAGQLGLP